MKESSSSEAMSLRSTYSTGRLFFIGVHCSHEETWRPSNQVFPLYLRLKKASIMERFRDFPNLLGRVKR